VQARRGAGHGRPDAPPLTLERNTSAWSGSVQAAVERRQAKHVRRTLSDWRGSPRSRVNLRCRALSPSPVRYGRARRRRTLASLACAAAQTTCVRERCHPVVRSAPPSSPFWRWNVAPRSPAPTAMALLADPAFACGDQCPRAASIAGVNTALRATRGAVAASSVSVSKACPCSVMLPEKKSRVTFSFKPGCPAPK
jgi:hypothetical protein